MKRASILLPLLLVAACASTEESTEVHEHAAASQPTQAAPAASTTAAAAHKSYDKPGFVTDVVDGRLWIFRDGSDELAEYRASGEPTKSVIKIGAGPDGMTVKAPDMETIEAYMAAAPGFATFVVDGRIWVFPEGDPAIADFQKNGEPSKHVTRIGAGPMRMTIHGPDYATIDAYLKALGR